MSKFVMLGMSEEHASELYKLACKEIETIDIVLKDGCFEGVNNRFYTWLTNRKRILLEAKSMLTFVFE